MFFLKKRDTSRNVWKHLERHAHMKMDHEDGHGRLMVSNICLFHPGGNDPI